MRGTTPHSAKGKACRDHVGRPYGTACAQIFLPPRPFPERRGPAEGASGGAWGGVPSADPPHAAPACGPGCAPGRGAALPRALRSRQAAMAALASPRRASAAGTGMRLVKRAYSAASRSARAAAPKSSPSVRVTVLRTVRRTPSCRSRPSASQRSHRLTTSSARPFTRPAT